MSQVKIAIVGRPNVGKSAIFNCICKRRIAIVEAEEGVTRDRIYGEATLFGKSFVIIDTGGIGKQKQFLEKEIFFQTERAIEEADLFIVVVDSKTGVVEEDRKVVNLILKRKKPLVLAVNKVDEFSLKEQALAEFYSLGIEKMVAVSASHNFQIAELLENLLENFEENAKEQNAKPFDGKIAIVGRSNVGKSTLLNYLIESKRSLVSDKAGTTRDSIDTPWEVEDKKYLLIDTAGIRRVKKERSVVEKFAHMRTERAIKRCDLALLIFDANFGITTEDKKIASLVFAEGKGSIVLFNKWDQIKNARMEHCWKVFQEKVPFLSHCPILFISAKTGQKVEKIYPYIKKVLQEREKRISTAELNRFIEKCMSKYSPPVVNGKRLKIYYLTQISSKPPHFVLFVNHPDRMVGSYKRYLINCFRKMFRFEGVPISFSLQGKKASKK